MLIFFLMSSENFTSFLNPNHVLYSLLTFKKIVHSRSRHILVITLIIKTTSLTEKQCHCHQITKQAAAEDETVAGS